MILPQRRQRGGAQSVRQHHACLPEHAFERGSVVTYNEGQAELADDGVGGHKEGRDGP